MVLADIKKLAKKRAKTKNPTGTAPTNVYGGVGFVHSHTHDQTPTTEPVGGIGDGGDGGGGE